MLLGVVATCRTNPLSDLLVLPHSHDRLAKRCGVAERHEQACFAVAYVVHRANAVRGYRWNAHAQGRGEGDLPGCRLGGRYRDHVEFGTAQDAVTFLTG